MKRLVTIMEEREKQAKDIVESIEREWATVGDRADQREAALRADTEKERRAREDVEKRLEQLESVMERMHRGELPVAGRDSFVPATPGRASGSHNRNHAADAMLGLSPTVAMVSRVQKGGKTFTEVHADYVRLEEEYAKKCAEYDHMDRTLSDVLAQIEERVRHSCILPPLAHRALRHPFWHNSVTNTSISRTNPHNSPTSSRSLSENVTPTPTHSKKCLRSLRSRTKRPTFSNTSSRTLADRFKPFSRKSGDELTL